MVQAFPRLKRILRAHRMTVPELHRRIQNLGVRVNLKSLYRLTDEVQPLERLDLRVAGVICEVCQIPLADLIAFESSLVRLRHLSAAKQKRLDILMAKNNNGKLTKPEQREFGTLVREAEAITLDNARAIAGQKRQLAAR